MAASICKGEHRAELALKPLCNPVSLVSAIDPVYTWHHTPPVAALPTTDAPSSACNCAVALPLHPAHHGHGLALLAVAEAQWQEHRLDGHLPALEQRLVHAPKLHTSASAQDCSVVATGARCTGQVAVQELAVLPLQSE